MSFKSELLHPLFSIKGFSYGSSDLLVFAQQLIKNGEAYEISIGQFFINWLNSSDTLFLSTSGTTSESKQLEVSKTSMVAHAKMSASYFLLKPGHKILHLLSSDFIAGKMILVRAMVLGLDLWFYPPSKAPLASLDKVYDWAALVPLQLAHSLNDLYKVKKILIGGAALTSKLKDTALLKAKEQQTSLYLSFGMTETLSHIAIALLETNEEPLFKVLPGIIISKNAQDCLEIRAAYLENTVIQTSDLIRLQSPDSFYWLGRADFTVNSGGVKLQPERIEKELSPFLNIPFFVFGIPDEILGSRLCLVVSEQHKKLAIKALETAIFSHPYYAPKSILMVKEFLYTSSEKIKRKNSLSFGFKEIVIKS